MSARSRASLQQVEREVRLRSAELLDQFARSLHVAADVVDIQDRSPRCSQANAATHVIITDVAATRC